MLLIVCMDKDEHKVINLRKELMKSDSKNGHKLIKLSSKALDILNGAKMNILAKSTSLESVH